MKSKSEKNKELLRKKMTWSLLWRLVWKYQTQVPVHFWEGFCIAHILFTMSGEIITDPYDSDLIWIVLWSFWTPWKPWPDLLHWGLVVNNIININISRCMLLTQYGVINQTYTLLSTHWCLGLFIFKNFKFLSIRKWNMCGRCSLLSVQIYCHFLFDTVKLTYQGRAVKEETLSAFAFSDA